MHIPSEPQHSVEAQSRSEIHWRAAQLLLQSFRPELSSTQHWYFLSAGVIQSEVKLHCLVRVHVPATHHVPGNTQSEFRIQDSSSHFDAHLFSPNKAPLQQIASLKQSEVDVQESPHLRHLSFRQHSSDGPQSLSWIHGFPMQLRVHTACLYQFSLQQYDPLPQFALLLHLIKFRHLFELQCSDKAQSLSEAQVSPIQFHLHFPLR